ncbi:MAG: ABC transporter substrate-binding protein [Ornithinibacter sp.]
MALNSRRRYAALTGVVAVALTVGACGSSDDDSGGDSGGDAAASSTIDCTPYEQFGDLSGTEVSTYSSVVAPEADAYEAAWKPFEDCTGVDVKGEWSKEFEAQIVVRVQSGNPPDIALFPQPGLLQTVVNDTGAVLPVFPETEAVVDENFSEDWKAYGTVDGTYYGFPNSSNSKSFVWYSPGAFADAGYEIPTTWEEMIALSDQIVADNPDGSVKPWCAGISSGDATGWPVTDWIEDQMLRDQGKDYYDQWVNHEVPFNAAESKEVWDKVGTVLRNEDYVNGGFGNVQTIASTTFQDGGLPILDGSCYMYKMASFYAANWPEGTDVSENGDVFAFYYPTNEGSTEKPVLVGSEFIAAFDERPEVKAFTTFMASADYANERAKQGYGFVSANLNLDVNNVDSPISKLAAEQFQDPGALIRFDGADLMPGAVGSGSFWKEATAWIAEGKDTQAVLDSVEQSWP